MLKRTACLLLLVLFLTFPAPVARAQDAAPEGPVYVIQPGDTFYSIALQFNVTVDDIVAANPDVNPNYLSVGAEVVIPGLVGVRGRLQTQPIALGESLRTLAIRDQILPDQLIRLNRLTSPSQVFAGASLIVPQVEDAIEAESRYLMAPNQSLLQLAVQHNLNPWLLAEVNQLSSTWETMPGEAIFELPAASDVPAETAQAHLASLISPVIQTVEINPLPIVQGETALVRITTTQPVELSGSLAGYPLHFFPNGENSYVALQGVHAMANAGIYPFTLQGKLPDGAQFSFEQMLVLKTLGYIREKIDGVDPSTLDPAITKPEEDQVRALVAPANPQKYWSGPFGVPGYDANWLTSSFGNRRSYNGSGYNYFHTGVDYGGGTGLPIKSPAAGVVVFASPLNVRGLATIIDHGWGVYSGFWHQSEFNVQVGDHVDIGQQIGLVGGTGRITGPHLHWEVWVNGVQVNPLTWLKQSFP